jgi:hypothetical protein
MKSNLVWDVMPFSPLEIHHSFIRLLLLSLGWKIKPCGGNSALCRKCRKELGTTGSMGAFCVDWKSEMAEQQ